MSSYSSSASTRAASLSMLFKLSKLAAFICKMDNASVRDSSRLNMTLCKCLYQKYIDSLTKLWFLLWNPNLKEQAANIGWFFSEE